MAQINLPEAEWRRRLTPDQYRVLREGDHRWGAAAPLPGYGVPGVYLCAGCRTELFGAADRIADTGDARPGFVRSVAPERITAHTVASEAPVRVAIKCAHCDSHLGLLCLEGPGGADARYRPHPLALLFRPRD